MARRIFPLGLVMNVSLGVRVVELGQNEGFTGGNIEGLKTPLPNSSLSSITTLAQKRLGLKILSNPCLKTLRWEFALRRSSSTIGKASITGGDGLTMAGVGCNLGRGKDPALFNERKFVFGACGAAAFYRCQMLDEIGFLDEDFFFTMKTRT